MKLTKANIEHKAKKIALALIQDTIKPESVEDRVHHIVQDLICTMGLKNGKKTRLQITRELKRLTINIVLAKQIALRINKQLQSEIDRRKTL